jgi:outer membrane murein-binding lipoprotein Lpp
MAMNYNSNRYRQPSAHTRLTESYEAHARTQDKLDKALSQIKHLEAEVARLERELANRG